MPFLSSALFTSLLTALSELQLVKALAFRPKRRTGQPFHMEVPFSGVFQGG